MIVQNVFDQAIHLMDAQNESTGSTTTADTKEYALRTPNIINTLLDQVYPYSGTYPSVEDVYGGGEGGESALGWGGIEYGGFGRW